MLKSDKLYDIVVVGCGPAGLSAALNAKARNKDVVVLGGEFCSLKLHKSPEINNYLGIPQIVGEDLRQMFIGHADRAGVQVKKALVDKIYQMSAKFNLMSKNDVYNARTVILATGHVDTQYLPGEEDLLGRGLSYCATCDGMFYQGKKVAVIAYDQEAEHEANFLADICSEVYFLPQYQEVNGLNANIEVIPTKPKAILGETQVEKLALEEGDSLDVDGIFIIRQITPVEQLVPGLETEGNVIKVNRKMATNIEGLYAAGDCTGRPWQLSKSVGEGQVAALSAVSYLDTLMTKNNIPI